jgi:putative ABC transport system permease protein
LLGTVGATLAIGLLPIVRLWQSESWGTRQGDSRSSTVSRGIRKASGVLVVAQVAFALILLVGATLLIQSYVRVQAVAAGFEPKAVLHARIALGTTYKSQAARKAVRDRIIGAVSEIPGVQSVAILSGDPIEGEFSPHALKIRSNASGAAGSVMPTTNLLQVSADFFATMGIRIVEGRGFTEADARGPTRVYIVDRSFAEKYFPGRSAVGEKFERPGPPDQWPFIIGVAENARFTRADERTGRPIVYSPTAYAAETFSLVLRTARTSNDLAPLLRDKVRGIDPSLPIEAIRRFDFVLDHLVDTRRGLMALLGAFALIALLLATVGIYGLLSYDVSRRTREIAVRGAIGATPGQIVRLVLSQGLGKVGAGLVFGLVSALYFTRFMPSLLFGVQPWNPFAYAIVLALLFAVATLSCWLPAWRAARIDPLVALRSE